MKPSRNTILVSIIYFITPTLVYLITTYPLVLNFDTSIYSDYFGDSSAYLVNKKASGDPYIITDTVVHAILTKFTSKIVSFNILVFLGFVLTYISGFILIKYLVREYSKATLIPIIGAILLTITPVRLRYAMEWPYFSNWYYILFYLYFQIKFLQSARFKDGFIASIVVILSFLNHPVMGTILGVLHIILSGYFLLIQKRQWMLLLRVSTIFLLGYASTIYFTMLNKTLESQTILQAATRDISNLWAYSARPWHYLIPDISNPVFGDLAINLHYKIWSSTPYYLTEVFFPKEHSLYIGIFITLISLFTIYKLIRKLKLEIFKKPAIMSILIMGLVGLLLSFPPYVVLLGLKIYLPSYFMYQVLPQFRAYARFGVFVIIANILISSIGFSYIYENMKDTKKTLYKIGFFCLVVLMIIEYINFPSFHNINTSLPESYVWLKEQEEDFAYLEVPSRTDYSDQIYANQHDKTLLNPYLTPNPEIKNLEKYVLSNEKFCPVFKKYKGKYIMFHKDARRKQIALGNFTNKGLISKDLKVLIAKSWGQPVFGNHVEKSEQDKIKDYIYNNMEDLLKSASYIVTKKEFDDTIIFEVVYDKC